MIDLLDAEVLANERAEKDIYLMRLFAPRIVKVAKPGQFVHVRCSSSSTFDPLLRRPLSIHDVYHDKEELILLYKVRGRGTEWLAGRNPGSRVNVLGPIGQSFTLPAGNKVAIVAGGLGIVPLLFLARRLLLLNNEIDFFFGAEESEKLYQLENLQSLNMNLLISTDDGSRGFRGQVTGMWEEYLKIKRYDMAYACGPWAEMAEFARLAGLYSIPAEVALEERMACGVGACRGCVTGISDGGGKRHYVNVCTHGPVFDAAGVCWGSGL